MLSHDNLIFDAVNIIEAIGVEAGYERLLSYLPLSHIAAQTVDMYIGVIAAATLYFADEGALKGTLVNNLKDTRPTTFFAVPRVWEKIHEKMMQIGAQNGGLKKMLASWAKEQALQHYDAKMKGYNHSISSKNKMKFRRQLTLSSPEG